MAETCKTEGCKRPLRAKGYCALHYRKWRHGQYGKTRYKICSGEECKAKAFKSGFCEKHFSEWEKTTKGYKRRAKNSQAVSASA